MTDKLLYWLWLQDCLGSYYNIRQLLEKYGDAEAIFAERERISKEEKFPATIKETPMCSVAAAFLPRLRLRPSLAPSLTAITMITKPVQWRSLRSGSLQRMSISAKTAVLWIRW